jgi:Xaa-Pro dipeptidase
MGCQNTSWLATSQAGTHRAAALLSAHYDDADMSPNTHFLQIMASGKTITKTHHRATTRTMRRGEPVFLCFCGITNFHRFKLGFDRTFWIGDMADASQAQVYEVALASQEHPFRCGRATGLSFLEAPQLVTGDTTILQPGMVLVVDGSVTVGTFRAQIGDSFIITENGYETLTDHPKTIDQLIS